LPRSQQGADGQYGSQRIGKYSRAIPVSHRHTVQRIAAYRAGDGRASRRCMRVFDYPWYLLAFVAVAARRAG
jgi:hypothetical protein